MKKSASILLTVVSVLMVFTSVVYTGCKKDKCKGISCSNGGSCKDGNCVCPTGYTGVKCGDEVRQSYAKQYVGTGVDTDGEKYPESEFTFKSNGDDVTAMSVEIKEVNGNPVNSFDIKLETNESYSIVEKTDKGLTYTGGGTINSTSATMEIKVTGSVGSFAVTYANLIAKS